MYVYLLLKMLARASKTEEKTSYAYKFWLSNYLFEIKLFWYARTNCGFLSYKIICNRNSDEFYLCQSCEIIFKRFLVLFVSVCTMYWCFEVFLFYVSGQSY